MEESRGSVVLQKDICVVFQFFIIPKIIIQQQNLCSYYLILRLNKGKVRNYYLVI